MKRYIHKVIILKFIYYISAHSVAKMYCWHDIAKRTEIVYERALSNPAPSLAQRLRRYNRTGGFSGAVACIIMVLLHFMWRICEFLYPEEDIEICPDICIARERDRTDESERTAREDS